MYANLVEQQTATTGTGSYVVSGSITGRRTFAQAYPADATNVPYVVTDDVGGYEFGLGSWTVATLTLARTKVLASSNANAAVSWAAGTRRIYVGLAAEMVPGVSAKHNTNAADNTYPGNSNNASEGYAVGSTWQSYDTTNLVRRCFMLQYFSGANAIWAEIALLQNPTTTSPSLKLGTSLLYGNGYHLLRRPGQDQAYGGIVMGTGLTIDTGVYNQSDVFNVGFSAYTTGATATKMALDSDIGSNDAINLGTDGAVTFEALVTARKSNGDNASWKVTCVAHRTAGTTTIDLNTATSLYSSAGATAGSWAVTCVTHSTYGVAIQVTGEAASNITWSAVVTGSLVDKS
jgi:hypothetical protein